MEVYFILALIAIVVMSIVAYVVGRRSGQDRESGIKLEVMQQRLDEAQRTITERDSRLVE